MTEDKKQQAQTNQIKIADNIPGGEYANAMQVNHNKDEFQMMFISLMGASGKVCGKIITSPGHYKRMIAAMQDNLKKYEETFGEVKEASAPETKEIGFKG
jgi:DNA gyrase inhibitor GyrI